MRRRRTSNSSLKTRDHLRDQTTYESITSLPSSTPVLFSHFIIFCPISHPHPPLCVFFLSKSKRKNNVGSHNSQSFHFLATPGPAQVDEEEVENKSPGRFKGKQQGGKRTSTCIAVVRRFSRGNRSGTTTTTQPLVGLGRRTIAIPVIAPFKMCLAIGKFSGAHGGDKNRNSLFCHAIR